MHITNAEFQLDFLKNTVNNLSFSTEQFNFPFLGLFFISPLFLEIILLSETVQYARYCIWYSGQTLLVTGNYGGAKEGTFSEIKKLTNNFL